MKKSAVDTVAAALEQLWKTEEFQKTGRKTKFRKKMERVGRKSISALWHGRDAKARAFRAKMALLAKVRREAAARGRDPIKAVHRQANALRRAEGQPILH